LADLREAANFDMLISLLKETVYGSYLSKAEDRDLNPRRVVYQIKGRIADSYLNIIHAAPPYTRPLLVQLYRHFELDNLKAILRGNVTGSSWDQVRHVLFPLGAFTDLPGETMVESGNVGASIEQLVHTPYYYVLSHAMQRYTNEQSLFPLEVALDLDYWRKLWDSISNLPDQDQSRALQILGPMVDMTNLMWAVRYRIYHHLAEEEIINYTLSFGYHLRDDDIKAIAAGGDISNIVEKIYPNLENINTLVQQPLRGLSILELLLQRFVADQCKEVFTGYPFHIGLELAILVLTELEIRDLTVLIEAKSSNMPYEDYGPYLVTSPDAANLDHLLNGA